MPLPGPTTFLAQTLSITGVQLLSEAMVPAARPMSTHYWVSIKVKSLYNLSTYLGELKELVEIIYKLLYTNCLQAVNDA